MAVAACGVMSPARKPGRPLSIANMVQRCLEESVNHLPEYFNTLHRIATNADGNVPPRQQLEAGVYLVNRHLGTPTSIVDVKTVQEARLSPCDLLEIAQLVRQLPRMIETESPLKAIAEPVQALDTPHCI
jgi:hypothetical protein